MKLTIGSNTYLSITYFNIFFKVSTTQIKAFIHRSSLLSSICPRNHEIFVLGVIGGGGVEAVRGFGGEVGECW